jgi:hypothetical protein
MRSIMNDGLGVQRASEIVARTKFATTFATDGALN